MSEKKWNVWKGTIIIENKYEVQAEVCYLPEEIVYRGKLINPSLELKNYLLSKSPRICFTNIGEIHFNIILSQFNEYYFELTGTSKFLAMIEDEKLSSFIL